MPEIDWSESTRSYSPEQLVDAMDELADEIDLGSNEFNAFESEFIESHSGMSDTDARLLTDRQYTTLVRIAHAYGAL